MRARFTPKMEPPKWKRQKEEEITQTLKTLFRETIGKLLHHSSRRQTAQSTSLI